MKKLNFIVGVLVTAALLLLIVLFVMSLFTDDMSAGKPVTSPTPPVSTVVPTPTLTDETTDDAPIPTDDVQTTPEGPPLVGDTLALPALFGREMLMFTNPTELFTYLSTDVGALFYLKSDPTNDTFIEIIFKEGDLEFYKASFLDYYIPNFTSMDALGQVLIAGSDVAAEGIAATNGTNFAEAWLIDVEGGFFAVVAGYSDDALRAELYRLLDTLVFEP